MSSGSTTPIIQEMPRTTMRTNRVKRIRAFFLKADNVLIACITVLVSALLYVIPQNVDFLDPLGQALGDIDLTDLVFSQFRTDQMNEVDTSIVLINIGRASRSEIAYILERINIHSPKVVGVDVFFRAPKDPEGDERLQRALRNTPHLVMASKVAYRNEFEIERDEDDSESEYAAFDTLIVSDPMFMDGAATGFTNLVIDQESAYMTCREIALRDTCAGKQELAFALRIASFVNPQAVQVALQRELRPETIMYHGNVGSFYHVDVDQALDPEMDLSIVHDKVVILGYMGGRIEERSLEDVYFTPLNERYVGRAFPDMHGVVIHANVVSMILRQDYVNTMPFWASIVFGLVLLYVNVSVFTFLFERYESFYDMIALLIQLVQSVVLLFLVVYVFDTYHYKLAFTPALFGVFLVGTVHDVYQDSIKKVIQAAKNRRLVRNSSATSQVDDSTHQRLSKGM